MDYSFQKLVNYSFLDVLQVHVFVNCCPFLIVYKLLLTKSFCTVGEKYIASPKDTL